MKLITILLGLLMVCGCANMGKSTSDIIDAFNRNNSVDVIEVKMTGLNVIGGDTSTMTPFRFNLGRTDVKLIRGGRDENEPIVIDTTERIQSKTGVISDSDIISTTHIEVGDKVKEKENDESESDIE